MPLTTLDAERFPAYFDFCRRNYPWRRHIPERFQQQVLNNPLLSVRDRPNILMVTDDAGAIVGHFGLNPFLYHHQGVLKPAFCGFDYFVEEAHRSGMGALLAMKALTAYRPFFAIGVSEVAEQIYLKLRCRTIGSLRRFLWLRSLLRWSKVVGDRLLGGQRPVRLQVDYLPELVTVAGVTFSRLAEPTTGWQDAALPDAELTFAHPPAFLRWRFFMPGLVRYGFYALNGAEADAWFVVRGFGWRGLSLLAVVDYRASAAGRFSKMLAAAKALAVECDRDGVIVFSSHHRFDAELLASGFGSIGRPSLIMTNASLQTSETTVKKREVVFATLADYDLDFAGYD